MFIFREHPCGEKQRRHPLYSSQAAACPAPTACMRPTGKAKESWARSLLGARGTAGRDGGAPPWCSPITGLSARLYPNMPTLAHRSPPSLFLPKKDQLAFEIPRAQKSKQASCLGHGGAVGSSGSFPSPKGWHSPVTWPYHHPRAMGVPRIVVQMNQKKKKKCAG